MSVWKAILVVLAGGAALYLISLASVYVAMRQPPERFGAFMSHVTMPAMMLVPFRPLWMSARGGHLKVGDPAPDFTLPLLHGDRTITLSHETRQKPVVLIFGSFT